MDIGAIGVSSFPSSSYFGRKIKARPSSSFPVVTVYHFRFPQMVIKLITMRNIACSAAPESYFSTVAVDQTKQVKAVPAKDTEAPAKPKPAAKAPANPLPQVIQEEVIPSLQKILAAQDDISEIELSFEENTLKGTFLKKGIPHSFWAFFPDGVLTGPKGFSLSSYGSEPSTVEPFLIDEKRITSKHVVFWVEKRLAAQGIIPVWK